MHFEDIKDCSAAQFKRLTGVRKETFEEMRVFLAQHLRDFGRPPALCRADQLLLTLMYFREYRTQLHIAKAYKVSESAVCRTIQKVEKALLASDKFHLPGKKARVQPNCPVETIVVDATESAVERPKKTTQALQRQKEAPHPEGASSRGQEE
jgi:predicted DNA-binding protein YlxM (UPF0122 family)